MGILRSIGKLYRFVQGDSYMRTEEIVDKLLRVHELLGRIAGNLAPLRIGFISMTRAKAAYGDRLTKEEHRCELILKVLDVLNRKFHRLAEEEVQKYQGEPSLLRSPSSELIDFYRSLVVCINYLTTIERQTRSIGDEYVRKAHEPGRTPEEYAGARLVGLQKDFERFEAQLRDAEVGRDRLQVKCAETLLHLLRERRIARVWMPRDPSRIVPLTYCYVSARDVSYLHEMVGIPILHEHTLTHRNPFLNQIHEDRDLLQIAHYNVDVNSPGDGRIEMHCIPESLRRDFVQWCRAHGDLSVL